MTGHGKVLDTPLYMDQQTAQLLERPSPEQGPSKHWGMNDNFRMMGGNAKQYNFGRELSSFLQN